MFISFLYMFRATMCPSSREISIYATLGICHSVWVTAYYARCKLDSHPHRVGTQSPETCTEKN